MNANFNKFNSSTMRVKNIVDEDFQDYKKSSMLIATVSCDFKCLKECGISYEMCQNSGASSLPDKNLPISEIYSRYISNPITKAIVIGGLEPMLQFEEIYSLISYFRSMGCEDDFVIYTGYYANEINEKVKLLKEFKNIIIKYGRFIPDSKPVYDNILGVNLISENQHAVKIS